MNPIERIELKVWDTAANRWRVFTAIHQPQDNGDDWWEVGAHQGGATDPFLGLVRDYYGMWYAMRGTACDGASHDDLSGPCILDPLAVPFNGADQVECSHWMDGVRALIDEYLRLEAERGAERANREWRALHDRMDHLRASGAAKEANR